MAHYWRLKCGIGLDRALRRLGQASEAQQHQQRHPYSPVSITVPDTDEAIQSPSPVRANRARSVDTDALVIRRACRFDCYCRCHKQSVKVSKELFSEFNSPIFKQSKGSRIECSEPDCADATSSQTRVLPSAFFRRVFPRLASMQEVRVRYNLNTYRMVSEGSDAMRYVKHGNLDKLKMCISSREATPWDTAPDGWSLLHVDLSSYLFTDSNANISRPPSMQGNCRA